MTGEKVERNHRRKGRIASRVRNINMLLLIFLLVLFIGMDVVMVTDITDKASKDLAFFYSLEAVNDLSAHMSRDLALVQKVAHSKAVTNWFANEDDPGYKSAAYDEMMDYIGILSSAELYIL